jgi:hemerythrin
MIAWTPALAVGIEQIDAQHRELFRRAELFLSGIESCSRHEIGVLLSYLRFYVVNHFGSEEEWMRELEYPDYAEHKRKHDRFLKDLLVLSEENERFEAPGLSPLRVATWLNTWLTDHVGRADCELAAWFLSRRGAAASTESAG